MTCTYRFVGTNGKQTVIKGQAAFKAFLADGGLEQLLGKTAPKFSGRQAGVLDRIPKLQEAAQGLKEGTVTSEQYNKLVNKLKPVTPYANVPAPATQADMERGLTSDKVERIGVPSETLKAGDPVGLRLDIPAYANHGVWVVSVHEQEAGYAAGKSIGYESVAAVTNPTFGVVEKAALAIAGGKPKATIAVMKGNWKPVTPKQASTTAKMAMKNDNWVQVGMDPTRHAYFYDRENMNPVVSADEAVQIGPLVLAKNPVYGKKSDFAFSKKQNLDALDLETLLAEYSRPAKSIDDADRALGKGDRVFIMHEMADDVTEISSASQLKGYTADQVAIVPANIKFSKQEVPRLTPEDVLQPSTIAAAKEAITKYKKAEEPDPLTAKDRARGESLLQSVLEAAENNKPRFDAVLDQVAEKVGGYAKKPGIKKMQRAVTKLIIENEWDVEAMKDLLRGTIVVSTFQEAQEAINEIGKVYTFDRIKNRLSADMVDPDGKTLSGKPLPTGYQDILTNVVLEDGTVAEIQISTPEMIAAKNLGHEVYAFEREMSNSPVKTRMVDLQKKIYSEGLEAYKRRASARALTRASVLNFSKTSSNSAASIGSPFSRTSEGLRGLGSGTQAVAKRQSGATVTGTSATSKNIVPGGKALKSNFIETSKQSITENELPSKSGPQLSRRQRIIGPRNAVSFSKRQPRGRETEGWILSRDELGRFRFGAGAKAYRLAADVANNVLDRVGLKPVSEELGRAMRKMKAEVERAQRLTVDVAGKMKDLPEQERQMISDVIEGELKRGVKPPKHVLMLAASLQSIMSEQSAELVRLGMLSPEAAGRWDGKYLPRFYEQKLGDEVKAWSKAAKNLLGRQKTMQGIGGSSLKSRGMFEVVYVADLADWEAEGWEVRDADYDPAVDDTVTVWRDYTRRERDDMGEIRDAMFRFVMGYNKSQRDIALGRLYESLSINYASKKEKPGYVKVPDTKVEDTMARRYGKLAGKWVPAEVMDHLSAFDDTQRNELIKMYIKGMSLWKEGKTVLNPVSHANNVLSNLTMAHFAGVSYWDIGKYAGAMRDLIKKTPMVEEALDAGLFGGTFNRAELLDQMPPQLKALAGMSESRLKKAVDTTWNAMSWFIRKPAASAYQAEDQFFRYLIYKEARDRGLDVEDSIDYAQNYIFTYDDLPKTARSLRDYALPFFAYTYKVVPPLVKTALEKPWRYAAPAAALYTVNALMYAMAASLGGGDDEDWWTVIRRYVTDPEFRDKARAMEDQERENLPPWMKGYSATLATPKAIRLGMDDVTNLPVFLDVSRVFPGGDLLDAHANAGGVPLLQPITPSNPILNTLGVMLWNKDSFFGKDIVDKTDTSAEATEKRLKWTWQQFAPAVAIGNYHWDRAMNVIANSTGQPVLGYTGISKDGLPVQPGFAAAQTVGIKIRPIDLELSAEISKSEDKRLARDLDTKIKQIKRLEDKGAITGEAAEIETEKLKQKKEFLKEGLTVEGKEKE
jgi:hypothetical protein